MKILQQTLTAAHSVLRRVGDSVWLAVAVGIYLLQEVGITHLGHSGAQGDLRRFLFFGTTVAVVLLAVHFRRYYGAWLVAAGIVLNVLPMMAHGGLMPVAYETIADSGAFPEITEANIGSQVANSKDVVLWRDDITFEQLSDRYFIDVPLYGPNIFSLGDFVVGAGLLLAAAQIIAGIFVARPAKQPPVPEARQGARG